MLTAILAPVVALALSVSAAPRLPLACSSKSQPNPIASTYPDHITGTINGTIAVLPLDLRLAQEVIGPEYRILTAAYFDLLPDFPRDQYPAIIQIVQDHDVQAGGVGIPDFMRISIEYPFVDLLDNSYSSFRLSRDAAMSPYSLGLVGAANYGQNVYPAEFDPPCDPYDDSPYITARSFFDPAPNSSDYTFFTNSFGPLPVHEISPYPLSFFINVTNQPMFADPARGCNKQIRLFNTSVSQPPYEPLDVTGTTWASKTFFTWPDPAMIDGRAWGPIWGVRLDTAFIEYNNVPCTNLA
ncbi:hypothetical protein B0J12DRAFT_365209 [Macrophomina phaseolina]|uniref:Uncharacterized protein n=1 Tax=Macrophomina phaseolina TaxID=35725 RepID=A0ABQ8FT98_9PEZI|nr:hypothetical protein B0J12DRAFT_365209 [Macrophomina phaseolina]